MISDETLMSRVAQRDVTAVEMLYDRHAALVLGVLMHIVDDRATAERLLEETFWQVWQRAAAYSAGQGRFTSWLFRLARRIADESLDRNRTPVQDDL